ncbi:OmpH family outer membrane protein [Desulfovibrio sp. OttesenSCG-928-O18]|nr:OmpH family outer membrane protein [Desulfovibrio sp. OttesenSCG-928-O18]
MRKALFLAVAICLLSVVTAQAADLKIAIFNSRAVAARSEPFTAAQKKIQAQFSAEKSKLDAQGKSLEQQAADLQKQRAAMSREAFAEKSDAFMRTKRNFEDAAQSYSRKVEAAMIRIDQEFGGRLIQAVQDYGMRSGYDLIIDAASTGVAFHNKSIDVTEDLIKEVARVYKEGKPITGKK